MQTTKAKYRHNLPQLSSDIFMTDGGVLTTMIFKERTNTPYHSVFPLLYTDEGYQILLRYNTTYAALARKYEVGLVLESDSWHANSDWGEKLGYTAEDLVKADQKAIQLLYEVREKYETPNTPIVICGCVGPRGDGYEPTRIMSVKEAEEYHLPQIKSLSEAGADMVSVATMNYVEEALGFVKAAQSVSIPVVVSFTVETNGNLPSGQSLKDAIERIDKETNNGPVYYMINCAHPVHFRDILVPTESWTRRIRGIRANASKKSHAELNECETLDEGDPMELGDELGKLVGRLENLIVVGGCCGTDEKHVEEIIKRSIQSRRRQQQND